MLYNVPIMDDIIHHHHSSLHALTIEGASVVQKWEYLTLESSRNYGTTKFYVNGTMQPELKNKRLSDVMNMIGTQGWEMVGIATDKDGQTFIFKRGAGANNTAPQPQMPPKPKPTT
jgi:hypothetical protein